MRRLTDPPDEPGQPGARRRQTDPPEAAPRPGFASRPPRTLPSGALAPVVLGPSSRRECPQCGREQGTTATPIPPQLRAVAGGADVRWFWSECACEEERRLLAAAAQAQAEAAYRERLRAAVADYDGLKRVAHLQLRSFNPARLRTVGAFHPYDIGTGWVMAIADLDRSELRGSGPPPALWFYCPNPGRGKTHLAAALALDHRNATQRPVAFVDGRTWADLVWATPWDQRLTLRQYPGERAHLTVFDDIGRVGGGNGTADEWEKLVDLRYLAQRWTIFTAQMTPDDLLAAERITDATHSRIRQMTRGRLIYFDGDDQRLAD